MIGPVVGVDPGGITGIAVRSPFGHWALAQVTADLVIPTLVGILDGYGPPDLVAVEAFVVGPRAARSSTPAGGATARALIERVQVWCEGFDVRVALRPAAAVKPWATDKRLLAAAVPAARGMPHAHDGARHALFAAVRDAGLPDPLSSTAHHRSPR